MIASVQPNYAAAIQDALGNSGASLRITTTAGSTSAAVIGTPTGLTKAASTGASQLADTVKLSPQAQAHLTNATIALTLISNAAANAKRGTAITADAASKGVGNAAATNPNQTETPAQSGIVAATSTVSFSFAGAATAAQAASSDPNAFYDSLGNKNELDATLSSMGAEEERSSFLAAFNSRTLNIQNTSDIPGLDVSTTTVLTGTSEVMSGSGYNSQVEKAAQDQGGGYSMMLIDPLGGSQLVTWGSNPTK